MWALNTKDFVKTRKRLNMCVMLISINTRVQIKLRGKLGKKVIRCCMPKRRVHWYGHVIHIDKYSCIKKCRVHQVDGGKLRKTRDEVMRSDLRMLNLRFDYLRMGNMS